jgi:hypothetical protein
MLFEYSGKETKIVVIIIRISDFRKYIFSNFNISENYKTK